MAKLAVTVVPRSSKNEIIGYVGEYLKIRLAAPPVDGEANNELIKYLSKLLSVPKTNIRIISGASSRRKLIEIDNIDQSELRVLASKNTR